VGVVGAGSVADGYHIPVLRQLPGVDVKWICDLDGSKAAAIAARHHIVTSGSTLEALGDVDAILVAIPVGARAAVLDTAFTRRWHLLIEKPFAVGADEHRAIIDRGREAGIEIGVGFMRRFYRAILQCRALIEAGTFGPVREVWAAEGGLMRGSGRGDDWYQGDAKAAGGGVLSETGSHLIDQSVFITAASGMSDVHATNRGQGGLDLETFVSATMRREGQRDPFALKLVVSRLRAVMVGVVIRCEHAMLRCGVGPGGRVELLADDMSPRAVLAPSAAGADAVYQAFALEWLAFIEQCRTGRPSSISAPSAVLTTAIIEASYQNLQLVA
jgi:predicted dehydrogenase